MQTEHNRFLIFFTGMMMLVLSLLVLTGMWGDYSFGMLTDLTWRGWMNVMLFVLGVFMGIVSAVMLMAAAFSARLRRNMFRKEKKTKVTRKNKEE